MTKIKKVLVEISSKKFMAVVVSMLFVLNIASPVFAYVEEDLLGPATNEDYSQKGINTKVNDDAVNAALKKENFTVEKLGSMLAAKHEPTPPFHQPQFIGFCKQNGYIVEEGNNRYLTKAGIEALVSKSQTKDEIYNSLDLGTTGIESSKGSQGTVTQLYKGEKEGTITLSVELPTNNNNSITVKMTVADNDNIFSKYGSKDISLSDIQVSVNETLTNDNFDIKNDGYYLKADSVSKVTVSLPTQATAEQGNKAEIPEMSKILESFGKGAAGSTYHSFPEYNSTKDAYTFISTGKNGYKFEISVPVIDGNKEEAKSKADKVGTLLLWANNAEEIQEGLKDANASVVVKQNNNEVATFSYDVTASKVVAVAEQQSQNSWVQDIIAKANEAIAKAKERVQEILAKLKGNSQTTQQVSSETNTPSWLDEAKEQLSKGENYSVSIDTTETLVPTNVIGEHTVENVIREDGKYYVEFSVNEKSFRVEITDDRIKNIVDAYDPAPYAQIAADDTPKLYITIPEQAKLDNGVISEYSNFKYSQLNNYTHSLRGPVSFSNLPVYDIHKETMYTPTDRGYYGNKQEAFIGEVILPETGRKFYVQVSEEQAKDAEEGKAVTASFNLSNGEYIAYNRSDYYNDNDDDKHILPLSSKYLKIEVEPSATTPAEATQQVVTEQQSQNSWVQDIIARVNEAIAKANERVQEIFAKLKGNSQTSVTFSDKNNNVLGVTTGTSNGQTVYYAEVEGTVDSKKQTVLVEISKENYEQYTNTGAEINKATISFDSTEFKVDKNGELIIPNKNVNNFNVERKTYDIAEFSDVANASITASKNNVVVKKDNGQDKYYVQILDNILPEDNKVFVEISKNDYDRIQKSGSVTVSVNFNTKKLKGINQNGEMLIPKEDGIVKEVVVNATISDYKKTTNTINGMTTTVETWTDESGQFHNKDSKSYTDGKGIKHNEYTETVTKNGQQIKQITFTRTIAKDGKSGDQTTTNVTSTGTTVLKEHITITGTDDNKTYKYTNRKQTKNNGATTTLDNKTIVKKTTTNNGTTTVTYTTTVGTSKTITTRTTTNGKVKTVTKSYKDNKLVKTTTRNETKITHSSTTKDSEGNVTHYDTATGKAIYTEMKNGDIQCCDVKGEYIGRLTASTLKDLNASEKKAVINKYQKIRNGDKDALSLLTTSQIKKMNINMSQAALIEATELANKYSIWSKISGDSFDSCTYEYDKSAKKWKVVGNGKEGYKFVTYVNSEKAAEKLSDDIYNAAIKGRANLQTVLKSHSVDIYREKARVAIKAKDKKGMSLINVHVDFTVTPTQQVSSKTNTPSWLDEAKEQLLKGANNYSVSINANDSPSVTPTQQVSAKQVVEETINIPVTNRAGIGGVFVEGDGGLITTKANDGKTWIRAEVPYNLAKAALMDKTIDNGNILITIKGNDFKKEDGGTYYVKEENVEVKVKATIVGNNINVYDTDKNDLISIDVTGMTNAQKNSLVNAYNEAIMKDAPIEDVIATLNKNANDYRTLNSQGYRWDTNGSLILKDGTTIAASQFNNFTSQQKDSVVKKWKETNNVSDVNAIIKKYQLDNEFSSSFGDVAAGYTYCSFPEYNAKTNSYEFVATGKNGYKIEVSVPVIGMDKGTAKNKANKIGDLLLDAKSAEELQNGLKTVNYTIKKNNKAVSTVNNVKTEKIPVSLYNSAGDLVFYNTSSGNSIGTIKAAELKGLTSAEKNNAISIFSKNGQNSAALKLVKEYVSERQTNYKQNLWKKLFKSISISSTYDSETKSLVFQDGSGFEVSIYVGSKNAAKTLEKELDKCTSWTAARSKLEKYKITFIKNDKVLGISNKGTTEISLK